MNTQPQTVPPNTTFLTVKDVMALLKVSRTTVHNLTKADKLQGYKVGRNLRYKYADVQSLMIPIQ